MVAEPLVGVGIGKIPAARVGKSNQKAGAPLVFSSGQSSFQSFSFRFCLASALRNQSGHSIVEIFLQGLLCHIPLFYLKGYILRGRRPHHAFQLDQKLAVHGNPLILLKVQGKGIRQAGFAVAHHQQSVVRIHRRDRASGILPRGGRACRHRLAWRSKLQKFLIN